MALFSSVTSTGSKHGPVSSFRAELARILALVAICAAIWITHTDRWSPASWRLPTDYSGDAMEILARIKAASEGDTIPLAPQRISRLGAPFAADWNAYPTPEKFQLLLLGLAARAVDIYFAANLGLLLALLGNAAAFYWVVRRWLRVRWEWAMAGALLFAFTYSTFHRGLAHFSFVLTAGIPIALLACWLVSRGREMTWRSPAAWTCVAAGALLACHNTYYLYFWLPIMGWALVAQWLGRRRRTNLQVGAAAIGAALGVFFLLNFEYWFHRQTGEALPLLERNYGGTERYALKPVEMLIPPAVHRWDALAFFGARYTRWSEWRGEVFLPYLGLAGIGALAWLLALTVRRVLTRQSVPGQALVLTWIIAFATIGGITNVLALFVQFNAFRATSRIGVFVSAVLLVFLVVRLSRRSVRWPRWVSVGGAAALCSIGVADQVPEADRPEKRAAIASNVEVDRKFGAAMEERLPASAMVFQLPVVGFPEVQPPWRLGDYEHFRPYLNTTTLHFSYGVPKYRPRGRWQQDVAAQDAAQLTADLESYGFAALYLNRKGFEDDAAALIASLEKLGYRERIVSASGRQVLVPLRPAPSVQLPLARTLTLGRGWHLRPGSGSRWAYRQEAALLYYNPFPEELAVDIELTAIAPDPREVTFSLRDQPIGSVQADAEGRPLRMEKVLLQPGINCIFAGTEADPIRGPGGSLRAFGVSGVRVKPAQ
jgi:hypothetical protein